MRRELVASALLALLAALIGLIQLTILQMAIFSSIHLLRSVKYSLAKKNRGSTSRRTFRLKTAGT